MDYRELKIRLPREALEEATWKLAEMGITSTQIVDNAIVDEMMAEKQAYAWDYIEPALVQADRTQDPQICVYVEESEEGLALMAQVKRAFAGHAMEMEIVREQDWVDSYKRQFKVQPLTSQIVVRPSWEPEEKVRAAFGSDKKIIVLDPGMALGTGSHETTALCAALLEELGCSGRRILDIGTGSGILAMAAAAEGAERVLGIDIDPTACQVAEENIRINGMQDRVEICEGDLVQGVDWTADIVVANLMADLICMLSAHVPAHLCPGGIFISSGILIEKKQDVLDAVRKAGMEIMEIKEKGEWCAIAAKYA